MEFQVSGETDDWKGNFIISGDECPRGQSAMLEINGRGPGTAWESLLEQVTSEL